MPGALPGAQTAPLTVPTGPAHASGRSGLPPPSPSPLSTPPSPSDLTAGPQPIASARSHTKRFILLDLPRRKRRRTIPQRPGPGRKKLLAAAILRPVPALRDRLLVWAPAAVALIAHAGGLSNGFTNWDDPDYLLRNPLTVDPLAQGAAGLLLTPDLGYPVPVTVLALAGERAL